MANDLSVALKIQAIVEGLTNIGALIDEIQQLGGDSQRAGAQAETLGAQLSELGKKQQLIDQFTTLKRELLDTSTQLDAARNRSAALAQEFNNTANPSKSLTREFDNANKATRALADQEQRQLLALQGLRGEMSAAGINSKELAATQLEVRRATKAAEDGFTALKQRLTEVRNETSAKLTNPTAGIAQGAGEASQALHLLDDSLKSMSEKVRTVGDGVASLRTLAGEIKQLGGNSEVADKLVANLASELEGLSKKQQLIEQFATLKRELQDTSTQLEASRAKTAALAQQFKAAESPSKALANEFARAREESRQLADQELRQQTALQGVRTEMAAAGISSQKLALSQAQVRQAVGETEGRVNSLKQRLTEMRDAAKQQIPDPTADVRRGVQETEGRFDSLLESLKRGGARILAFIGVTTGLYKVRDGIQSIIDTGSKFENLEIRLTALMGSLEGGQKATAWIKDFARATPLGVEGVTEAFARLKTFGLDPMNGTLQALVDANSKMGGSQELLERIILAVGQAWTKQKLQGQEVMQLNEAGIPVWDLLTKAMGKNVVELQSLSEKGRLGRTEIALLIDEIGKGASGAAAAQMGTWTGLVSNLGDIWQGFLDRIARSGALDAFKRELKDVLDTTEQMANDGRLQRYAQQVSDALISMARIVKGTVTTLIEFKDALVITAQAFLLVKVGRLATDFLIFAEALRRQVIPSVAASGAEATAAAGKFTLLGRVIGLLPRTVRVALVLFGIEAAIKSAQLLGEALAKYGPAGRAAEEALRGVRAEASRNAEQSKVTANEFERYANLKIKSSAEIARLTAGERTAYLEALKGAEQYQIAILATARSQEILGNNTQQTQAAAITALREIREAYSAVEVASKKAETATTGLSPAINQIIADFERLRSTGKDASEALADILKQFDPGSLTNVRDVVLSIDELAKSGRLAGDEIDKSLRQVIDKLSGEDLVKLQLSVSSAFGDTIKQSRSAQAVIDETVRAAFKRLGLDADRYMKGVSSATSDAISSFDALTSSVGTTNEALAAGFDKALNTADTQRGLDLLKEKVVELRKENRITADQAEEALRLIGVRADQLSKGPLDAVSNAFKTLGLTARSELQRIADEAKSAFETVRNSSNSTTKEIEAAFLAYAKKAIDANNGVASTALTVQARFIGLGDELGKLTKKADDIKPIEENLGAAGGAADKTKEAVNTLGERLKSVGLVDARQMRDELVAAFEKSLISAQEFERQVGQITQRINELEQAGTGMSQALASPILRTREELKQFGDEAVAEFDRLVQSLSGSNLSVEKFWDKLAKGTDELRRKYQDLADDAERTKKVQVSAAEDLIDQLSRADGQTRGLITRARAAAGAMHDLDDATLDRLNRSIADAEQRLDALRDKAQSAVDSLQDELDRLRGNEATIEQRDYEKRLKELTDLRDQARAANDQQASGEAERAIGLLKQAHTIRMDNLKAEANAKAAQAADDQLSEQHDYQQRLKSLTDQRDKARAEKDKQGVADADYEIAQLNRQHQKKLDDLKAEADAAKKLGATVPQSPNYPNNVPSAAPVPQPAPAAAAAAAASSQQLQQLQQLQNDLENTKRQLAAVQASAPVRKVEVTVRAGSETATGAFSEPEADAFIRMLQQYQMRS